jgi:hypothetical protein
MWLAFAVIAEGNEAKCNAKDDDVNIASQDAGSACPTDFAVVTGVPAPAAEELGT